MLVTQIHLLVRTFSNKWSELDYSSLTTQEICKVFPALLCAERFCDGAIGGFFAEGNRIRCLKTLEERIRQGKTQVMKLLYANMDSIPVDFEGELILFGSERFKDWGAAGNYPLASLKQENGAGIFLT